MLTEFDGKVAEEGTNWEAAYLARLEELRLRRDLTFGVISEAK